MQRFKKLAAFLFKKEYQLSRTVRLAQISVIMYLLMALQKIGVGIYSLSLFLFVNGIFSIGLAAAKYGIIHIHKKYDEDDEKEQHNAYRRVGKFLQGAAAAYMGFCIGLASQGGGGSGNYDKVMVVTLGICVLVEIIIALQGLFRSRKSKNLTIKAAKWINLAVALVGSLLTVPLFEHDSNITHYASWLGIVCSFACFLIGVWMTWFKEPVKRKIRKFFW